MIPKNTILFLLLISFLMSVILVCAIFTIRKAVLRHSLRTSLAGCIFIFQIVGISFVVFSTLFPIGDNGPFQQILDTTGILSLLPVIALFTCYILEVKIPCSLTLRNILVLFSPLLTALLYILFVCGHGTSLQSVRDISDNIGKSDVAARLLVNVLYILYPVLVLLVRPSKKQDGVGLHIALLPVLFIIVTGFGIAGFGFRLYPCLYANALTLCVLDYLIIHLELFTEAKPATAVEPKKESGPALHISDEMWMDPEMTAERMSVLLGMNQRYLSEAIKKAGYVNYFDMVNSKRVEYICRKISDNPDESSGHLSAWMYDAGFRSRNTAINAFKKKMGCTPSEYLKSCLQ